MQRLEEKIHSEVIYWGKQVDAGSEEGRQTGWSGM